MQAVSGSVGRDEILTLGLVSPRVVTIQFAYIQFFYRIRTHQQTQDGMTEIQITYAGRNPVVEGSVLWHFAVFSFSSSQPAKERV
jgi:hypothetical protein